MIHRKERAIVGWSFMYFFFLLSAYFVLRPLRDEMGIMNGAANMHWLFTGTFATMLLIVPVFGYLLQKKPLKSVVIGTYPFFISNIIIFYLLFQSHGPSKTLAAAFFIWLSVFNLFVVSLFWSFMSDIYTSQESKRLFGIIAVGGSLGALTGPVISSYLALNGIENLLLMAAALLVFALVTLNKIILLKRKNTSMAMPELFSKEKSFKEGILSAVKKTFSSKYLMGIVLFIVLYTSISTFLYFEQAHILENNIAKSTDRIVYFSNIDFCTNALAIFGQFLFTSRIIKRFGLAITLASIPLLIGLGFIILSGSQTMQIIAIVMVIHRAGNFSLLRPGREILFTVTGKTEKYQAKNFIDTAIYRGSDTLAGWFFAMLLSFGFGLSIIALIAVPLALIWSLTGYSLGKRHMLTERVIQKNRR